MSHRAAEISDLVVPRSPLGLPLPAYDGRSLVNLAVSVHRAAGGGSDGEPPLSPPLAAPLDPFGGRRAEGPVVLFLIDGLGWSTLGAWVKGGSARAALWDRHARPITSVFPTTTTAALASLSTGVPPARHGLIGYRQYLPRFGVVADLLRMTPTGLPGADLLVGPTWSPSDVSGAPTLFRRGLSAIAVSRDRFLGSGFTRLLYDGAEYVGYATLTDLADELRGVLERPSPPPAVFLYWDGLDTIQHLKGPDPELAGLELEQLGLVLSHVARRLSPSLRARTTLLVTGDHGQVPSALASRLALEEHREIVTEMSRPLAGDRRAGFLAARPGRADALARAVAAHLPVGARIVTMEAALAEGLFGPPPYHPEISERLGDLLVLVPAPHGLTYRLPGGPVPTRHLFGAHGGLETDELVVPLVHLAFTDLAEDPAAKP